MIPKSFWIWAWILAISVYGRPDWYRLFDGKHSKTKSIESTPTTETSKWVLGVIICHITVCTSDDFLDLCTNDCGATWRKMSDIFIRKYVLYWNHHALWRHVSRHCSACKAIFIHIFVFVRIDCVKSVRTFCKMFYAEKFPSNRVKQHLIEREREIDRDNRIRNIVSFKFWRSNLCFACYKPFSF